MAAHRTARAALEFQLAAREHAFKAKLNYPLTRQQQPATFRWHKRQHLSEPFGISIATRSQNRGFATSSIRNATKPVPRNTIGISRGRASSKTIPSFQSKAPRQINGKFTRISPSALSSSEPPTLLPPKSTPPDDNKEQFFVLKHFERPPPIFIRGIRSANSPISLSLFEVLTNTKRKREYGSSLTPDTVPRLDREDHDPHKRIKSFLAKWREASASELLMVFVFVVSLFQLCALGLNKVRGEQGDLRRRRNDRRLQRQQQQQQQQQQRRGSKQSESGTERPADDDESFHRLESALRSGFTPINEHGVKEVLVQGRRST